MSHCVRCFDGPRKTLIKTKEQPGFPGLFTDLNEHEVQALGLAALGTATVYQGSCPESWLRSRVAKIVCANPWLAGHLCSNPSTGKIALFVCEEIDYQGFLDVKAVANQLHDVLGRQTASAWVKSGPDSANRHEPICKIMALTATGHWGLLISMSHAVADGHTFYTIHNMLDKDAEVWAMERKRVRFNPLRCLTDAPLHGKWLFWILQQHIVNPMKNCISKRAVGNRSALVFRVRYVRDEWLQEEKRAFTACPGAPFVSSQDLLASWFFQATKPACGAIVYNMRDHTEGLAARHAGSYTTLLMFYPEEYKSAANIRRAISSKSPACTLEGLRQRPGWGGRCGLVTSFHNLCRAVRLDGCNQLTHLPSGADTSEADILPPIAAIFRPLPKKLAMWTITEEELPSGPLGDTVFGANEANLIR